MKIERVARWISSSLILSLTPTGIARAQCLEYASGFGPQGGGLAGYASAYLNFDEGNGPVLCVGGVFTFAGNLPAKGVVRWDGTDWSPMGDGLDGESALDAGVKALVSFDDGSGPAIFAGGGFTRSGDTILRNVAKWNGSDWIDVGGGVAGGGIRALAVFDAGSGPELYAGGSFTSPQGTPVAEIVRWNGTSWSSTGFTLGTEVDSLLVHDDGAGPQLYAGGPTFGIARWDGTSWTQVGGGLQQVGGGLQRRVRCMTTFDDGTGPALYVGGDIGFNQTLPAEYVFKWDGQTWSGLGGMLDHTYNAGVSIRSLTVYDDGTGPLLYVGGMFNLPGGSPTENLASWDGASWTPVRGWSTGLEVVTSLGVFDDGNGPMLHVGGTLLVDGPVISRGIARWDGTSWHVMLAGAYEGLYGTPYSLAAFDDGTGEALYVGAFQPTWPGTPPVSIARWDGTSWASVGGGVSGRINGMKGYDDGSGPALFVGGQINNAGGVPVNNVAKWDGQNWSAAGNPGGIVNVLGVYDDGSGAKLYAGGYFSGGIKVWNGTSWLPHPAGGLDGMVASMTVHDDGSGPALYVGGQFARANNGTLATGRVAKWNGGSWIPLGCGLGVGDSTNSNFVYALASFDFGTGPELVAGGWFFQAGCASSTNIVRWNGSSWSSLPYLSGVKCLTNFDTGRGPGLYVGGTFAGKLAKWNGSSWSPLDGGLDGHPEYGVNALASFERVSGEGPDLFAAGTFLSAGGIVSMNIAQWRGCAGPGTEYCFGDGRGLWCPCSNNGAPEHGCENSGLTGGAVLSASGRRHPDTVVLTSTGERPTAISIFLQGNRSIGPVNYGDGLRCAGGALKRLYTKTASGGQISAPQMGDLSITARSAQAGDPIALGSTRYYQTYYRDGTPTFCPSPAGSTFNATNGIRIEW